MTSAAIEADLLPCGHCGFAGAPLFYHGADGISVMCGRSCQCRGPLKQTKAEAITAWNTRQPTTPTTGEDEVERLDAMIDMIISAYHTTRLRDTPAAAHIRNKLGKRLTGALAAISPTTEDAEKRELVEAVKSCRNGCVQSRKFWDDGCGMADILDRSIAKADKALASIGERS